MSLKSYKIKIGNILKSDKIPKDYSSEDDCIYLKICQINNP